LPISPLWSFWHVPKMVSTPLLKIEEHFAKKTWAILFILFFFLRRASEYPLFYSLGHLSIFSYFCIATCIFLQQNFGEIITRTLSIYLELSYRVYFWMFTLSVRAKHF
jgi:hypothetical protein